MPYLKKEINACRLQALYIYRVVFSLSDRTAQRPSSKSSQFLRVFFSASQTKQIDMIRPCKKTKIFKSKSKSKIHVKVEIFTGGKFNVFRKFLSDWYFILIARRSCRGQKGQIKIVNFNPQLPGYH